MEMSIQIHLILLLKIALDRSEENMKSKMRYTVSMLAVIIIGIGYHSQAEERNSLNGENIRELRRYGFDIFVGKKILETAKKYMERDCICLLKKRLKKRIKEIVKKEWRSEGSCDIIVAVLGSREINDLLVWRYVKGEYSIEIVGGESKTTITVSRKNGKGLCKGNYENCYKKWGKNLFNLMRKEEYKIRIDYSMENNVIIKKDYIVLGTKKQEEKSGQWKKPLPYKIEKIGPWTWGESIRMVTSKETRWLSFSVKNLPKHAIGPPKGGRVRIGSGWFDEKCRKKSK